MGAVLAIAVLWARHETAAPGGLTLEPASLLADGYDTATLTFHSARRPRISIDPPYAATVENIADSTARIRAGVTPAEFRRAARRRATEGARAPRSIAGERPE